MKKGKFSSIRCSNRGPARTKSRFSLQSVRCTSRESGGMPDYRRYRLSAVETFRFAAVLAVISLTMGILFYDSWMIGLILFILLIPLLKVERERLQKKRKRQLARQFRDGMQALAAALSAGYSVENAFAQAVQELQRIYGAGELLPQEFAGICRKMEMNLPVEGLLQDLAERSGLPDVQEFAAVFSLIKRSGGPLPEMLRGVTRTMAEKGELEEEIRTLMAGKRMEFMLMCVLPALILAYVRLGNPGFMDPVYTGLRGRLFMSACLAVYALAVWLGQRLIQIEV